MFVDTWQFIINILGHHLPISAQRADRDRTRYRMMAENVLSEKRFWPHVLRSEAHLLWGRGRQTASCWPQPLTASSSDRPWCRGCQCTRASCSPAAALSSSWVWSCYRNFCCSPGSPCQWSDDVTHVVTREIYLQQFISFCQTKW